MAAVKQTHPVGVTCNYGFVWPAMVDVLVDEEAGTYKVTAIRVPDTSEKSEAEVDALFTATWKHYRPELTRVD